MEINSLSGNYADLFQDIASVQASEIRKAAVMEQLGIKVAMASLSADEIISSMAYGGYIPDSEAPEDSTISFHV